LPRQAGLTHPARHLGLVQAQERDDLDDFLDTVAGCVGECVDLDSAVGLAGPLANAPATAPLPPPAQRIAIASDSAFAFAYPHLLADWRRAGAEITPFSPLADDPAPAADMIFLPGGYPELHAGRLAGNKRFLDSLKSAAETCRIYGECGGYMVLGEALTDADGTCHRMAGLLPLETSFATRRLHLGYRRLSPRAGPFRGALMAHEFHYATTISATGAPLFDATDAAHAALPPMGLVRGNVCGSFAHIIDRAD
jgi:cobyrinic acid a,c-diamide synthase